MVGNNSIVYFYWILRIAWYVRGICKGIKILKISGFVIFWVGDF